MDLMEEIKSYITDEIEAYATYSRMADDADDAGMHQTAQILRGMAADELRHKEMLEGMYYRPEFGPIKNKEREAARREYEQEERYAMGAEAAQEAAEQRHARGKSYQQIAEEQHYGMPQGYMPEGHRPFPRTYGDWVDLVEEMKHKVTDIADVAAFNHSLGVIGGIEEGDADEAKRWLVRRAGELNIR